MVAILWSILTFVYFLQVCNCSGVVEFRLDRYSFSCSGFLWNTCDLMFIFCFDKPNRSPNFDACEYKRTDLSSVYANQNDVKFGSNIGGIPNPIVFDKPSFGDPHILVAIRVYDKDDLSANDFLGEIQLTLKLAPAVNTSTATFVTSSKNYKDHFIQYAYRAYCNSNQYGVACDVTCIARNDSKGHYSCSDKGQKVCYTGWEGGNCTSDIDECTTMPGICNNGSGNNTKDTASNVACINTPGSYHCECVTGWKGDNCTTDIDECSSSNQTICQNGGTCSNNEGSYTCNCSSTWTGKNCSQDVDECTNTTLCQHYPGNRMCLNMAGSFQCVCQTGWKGDNCTSDIDECISVNETVCYNGGICTNTNGSYLCECPSNWTGINCTQDVDECSNTPPQNETCNLLPGHHTCVNTPGAFHCGCVLGWKGDNCTTDINECSESQHTLCYNGGVCSNQPGSYRCNCPRNWTGENCTEDVDECNTQLVETAQCKKFPGNWACSNFPGSYICQCQAGWQGDNCTDDINECSSLSQMPCYNGGDCINLNGSYRCECPSNWTGQNCSEDVDECAISSNGSSLCLEMNKLCQNTMGGFVCACSKGWKGDNCTVDVDECRETINECPNGTKCINTKGGFNCDCPSGWSGKNCSECVTETGCNGKSNGDTNQNFWPIILVAAILFIAIVVSVIIILIRSQRRKQKSALHHCPPVTELQTLSSDTVTIQNSIYGVMPTQRNRNTLDPREGELSQNSDNDGDTYQEDKIIYHEVDNEYNTLERTATPAQILQNTATNSGILDFNVYDHVGVVQPAKANPY